MGERHGPKAGQHDRRTVIILDADQASRLAVVDRFSASNDFELMGDTADAGEAVWWAARATPHLILIDVTNSSDPDALCRSLLEASPASRLVLLTPYFKPSDVSLAARLGCAAILIKAAPFEQWLDLLNSLPD